MEVARQKPVSDRSAASYSEMLAIVQHPAFRIGFLDAQHDRPFDHDQIMARIEKETPSTALQRVGWGWPSAYNDLQHLPLFMQERMASNRAKAVELAQYRYEEGRHAVKVAGLKCKAWGHPDYPPKAVIEYIIARTSEAKQENPNAQ